MEYVVRKGQFNNKKKSPFGSQRHDRVIYNHIYVTMISYDKGTTLYPADAFVAPMESLTTVCFSLAPGF